MSEHIFVFPGMSKRAERKARAYPRLRGDPRCPSCGVGHLVTKQRRDGTGSFVGCSMWGRSGCKFVLNRYTREAVKAVVNLMRRPEVTQ